MGGMTGVGTPELAAAISNAGGLGVFCAHNAGSPEGCRDWIKKMRTLTDKPFGVNLTILPSMGPPPPYEEYARVIIEEGVKVVETAGSNPKKWVTMFKEAGLISIHKCVAVRHAISAEKLGCDIISLDGFECGGHPGEDDIGNFVLQAKGAKVLTKPYVCSGGVGDGIQLAASLALGADGVNLGTRVCATKECKWGPNFKKRLLDGDERSTVLMFRTMNNTGRVFRNKVSEEVERIEKEKGNKVEFSDLAALVAGKYGREAEDADEPDGGIWTAGQTVGLIDDMPTCKELIIRMAGDAEAAITQRLNAMVVPSKL